MTNLKGIAWNHSRGFTSVVATAQRFEELRPDISIQWEKRSLQAFADASMAELAARFDLIVMDHPHTALAATDGLLLPYEDWLPAEFLSEQAANSVGASYDSYRYNGKQWTLATDAAAPIATWRPDLIEKHHLALPRTWQEVLDLALEGFVTVSAFPIDVLMHTYMFCAALGENPFQGSNGLASEDMVAAALEELRKLVALCDPACLERNPIRTADWMAQTGDPRAAYCPFAFGYSNYSRPGYSKNLLKAGGLVSLNGRRLRSTLGGAGVAVSSRTKHPRACMDYAQFTASPSAQKGVYFEAGGQPGHRSAWTDEAVNRASTGFFKDTLETLDQAIVRGKFPGYMRFQDEGTPVAHDAVSGKIPPTVAARRLNELYRKAFEAGARPSLTTAIPVAAHREDRAGAKGPLTGAAGYGTGSHLPKIASIEAIHLRIEDPNIGLFDGSYDDCLIVVTTDDGRVGIGEVESFSAAIVALVNGPSSHNHAMCLHDVLVGETLDDPGRLWRKVYEATDYVGRRGIVMHALGGVDLALWDLHGQIQGKPVHAMLGGAKRDRLPAYGTIYPLEKTPEGVKRQVAEAQAMNLRNFKLVADPWWFDDLALTGSLLRAGREQAGPDARLIVDAALAYRTVAEGLSLFAFYKDIGLWFLEAPLPLDDLAGHREMAGHGIDLGVGDLGLTHVDEYIEFMDRGGADICQPDITMVGGFTGIQLVAAAAFQRGKRVITHGYKTNIEIAANLHFLSVQEKEEILEFSTSKSPLRWQVTKEKLPVMEDGCVAVPNTPGLGITPDWEFINRHRYGSSANS